jgi:hypothetical protein
MNILYVNVIELNQGWGAENFVAAGFLANGDQVINLDYRKYRYWLAHKFLKNKRDFDSLLLQRGDGFPLDLLQLVNRPKFFWASELVSRRRDQDPLFKSGQFKHFFVRGVECRQSVIANGWAKPEDVSILLSGFDPQIHRKIEGTKKDIDVLFVGSVTKRRREILDRLNKEFKIVETKAYGREMVELFNRSKIVLNIHAADYLDTETRVFEVLGSGAFLLTERLSAESPFTKGIHLVEVDSQHDLPAAITHYLSHNEERERIANQGYQEAQSGHTYRKRAEQITMTMKRYLEPTMLPALDLEKMRVLARCENWHILKHGRYLVTIYLKRWLKLLIKR